MEEKMFREVSGSSDVILMTTPCVVNDLYNEPNEHDTRDEDVGPEESFFFIEGLITVAGAEWRRQTFCR